MRKLKHFQVSTLVFGFSCVILFEPNLGLILKIQPEKFGASVSPHPVGEAIPLGTVASGPAFLFVSRDYLPARGASGRDVGCVLGGNFWRPLGGWGSCPLPKEKPGCFQK